jgi:hypothetical protein
MRCHVAAELRGVWHGACPPLDPPAASGARHLGLPGTGQAGSGLSRIAVVSAAR